MEEMRLNSNSPSTKLRPRILATLRLLAPYVCWMFMMAATALATYFVEFNRSAIVASAFMGFFLGQFGLAAILGGMVGRTWIAGWLLSVCLAMFATAICYWMESYIGSNFTNVSEQSSRLVFCSVWPLLMLGACAPMIAMRGLRGWSLTLRKNIAIPKQTYNVEDLFLLTLIVASCITIANWMDATNPGSQDQIYFVLVLFFGFSLLFALPAAAITFRARNWSQRLVGWLIVTILAFAACVGVSLMAPFSSDPWEDVVFAAVGVTAASTTMIVGGVSLLLGGVKMTHFSDSKLLSDSPLAKGDEELNDIRERSKIRATKLQARVLSGVVVVCALASAVLIQLTHVRSLRFLRDVQNYNKMFPNLVSELTIRGERVVGMSLVPATTDHSLDRYREASHNTFERVSLAGTKITDGAIDKLANFPMLRHLDLSNTAITNFGLEKLKQLSSLSTLSLANTKVDLELALDVSKKLGVKELDVSGIGIADGDLASDLLIRADLSLKLSHNPVTDAGIAELLKSPIRLRKLDLSHTDIDGSSLVSDNCPSALILDRTKITDVNLIQILKKQFCRDVSIRSTNVTAAILPSVVPFQGLSLTLGEGNITEQDLINLPLGTRFNHLGLNHAKFTGDFLRNGKFQFQSLDLSNSGITDSALQNMVKLNSVSFVSLSHTQITDAGLPSLFCHEADLRHTKVTSGGIKRAMQIRRILIGHLQFTPEELIMLGPNLVIDGERTDSEQ